MAIFIRAFELIRSLWLRTILFIVSPFMPRLLPDPYLAAGHERVQSKPVHESRITMTETIFPQHCNAKGLAHAGTILGWIDVAAGISAKRHALTPCVTRSVDDVAFLHTVQIGDIITIQATVNKAWKTSMEVGVKVEAETPMTGERFFVAHAYLTFVALSPRPQAKTYLGSIFLEHSPIRVPEIIPHTAMEKKRYDMAEKRRQSRFQRKLPDLSGVREHMQSLSQGLKETAEENGSSARIRTHPALEANDRDDEDEQILSQLGEDQFYSAHASRRYSRDPTMLLQADEEKSMDSTFAELVELVMPQHANTLSITFGGQIMAWMEACALVSANRLAHAYLLTASVDSLQFIRPTKVGDVVTIRSMVSRTYTSSMEVYVTVEAENMQTSDIKFANDGFFTIVAIDRFNIPVKVPRALPESDAEISLCEGGSERRTKRLAQRLELINLVKSSIGDNTITSSEDPKTPS
ncbi:HotDog domain-containing protein [Dichotomocladium elegans]|nr:HotDog domain-containing protein [Dichotomocladium elegans]